MSESVSVLQGYPYAALYHVSVRVSEIQVKVSACFRNKGLHYTKVTPGTRSLLYEGERIKIKLIVCASVALSFLHIEQSCERGGGLLALYTAVTLNILAYRCFCFTFTCVNVNEIIWHESTINKNVLSSALQFACDMLCLFAAARMHVVAFTVASTVPL